MHMKTIIDFKELGQRYLFQDPITELVAHRLDQVGQVIEEVDRFQALGYYVVGYLSYEAAPFFDKGLSVHQDTLGNGYLAYFTVHKDCTIEELPSTYKSITIPNQWVSTTQKSHYKEAIDYIHAQMRQGNTYQVNYTIQLSQELNHKDSLAIYNKLVIEQAAGYNAYVAHDDFVVLSASPELFFKQDGQQLTTRPMKGTTKRGVNHKADQDEHDWLQSDAKNRSENMMIVDLLRNDMGKICQTDSISVSQLCQLERYSTVWQMTSTIVGTLQPQMRLMDILQALFPCGSITGAPKQATMAIIKKLEQNPRGVYCGSIGICLPDGRRIFNVAIRTIQLSGDQAIYGVGGGITWESRWQDEFEEIKQKTAFLYRQKTPFTLKTTARVDKKQITFYDEHLKRLREAADYFAYPYDEAQLKSLLEAYLKEKDDQTYRLTIELTKTGELILADSPLVELSQEFLNTQLVLQQKDITQTPFTYFKTSYRPHLKTGKHEQVYYSPSGQLLETSMANLFVEIHQKLYTPPVSVGILPGILRQDLLDKGLAQEKKLTLSDLKKADGVFGGNSVRGLYQLTFDDASLAPTHHGHHKRP
ncbi:aminodeoxychorismate synthase component I [Streptococcus phocae]|uniref:Aminobenzoate synthetase n=1 Tax=Streptococcus phocae TaxID=119224 RepID=A0A0P6SKS3_9STRE|nr:aminodeoxychorismate synthase component I [Streptococcus phocae]KPJ22112.1 aminobenzoate synthetase [Streptococcus phocae]